MTRSIFKMALLGVLALCAAAAVADTGERINPSPSAILRPWGMSALPMDQFKGSGVGNTVTIEHRSRNPRPTAPHHTPHQTCYWVNGGYTWTTQRVWVPDQWQQQYIPPVYEPRWVNGQQVWVVVLAGRYDSALIPAHYEARQVQAWMPGRWVCFCGRHNRH